VPSLQLAHGCPFQASFKRFKAGPEPFTISQLLLKDLLDAGAHAVQWDPVAGYKGYGLSSEKPPVRRSGSRRKGIFAISAMYLGCYL
jgi:hypothetical protein